MSTTRTGLLLFFGLFLLLISIFWFALQNENLTKVLSLLDSKPILEAVYTTSNTKQYSNNDSNTQQYSNQGFEYQDEKQVPNNPRPFFNGKDVVTLGKKNFTHSIVQNRYVMVVFYTPWCYWSKRLAPEYAAAATLLKGEAVLAKVDATEETELVQIYRIDGYPSLCFFVDGILWERYYDERTRDAIAVWVRRMMRSRVFNVTVADDAE